MSHLLHTTLAFITPESGASPNAESIDTLYKIVLYIAAVVFVIVEGALGYALFRFSSRRSKVALQTHGHTGLEIGWTAAAFGIVVVLAIVTLVKMSSVTNPPSSDASGANMAAAASGGVLYADSERRLPPNKKALEIEVIGRQYLWQYVYPGGSADGLGAPYSYEQMVVPTHTTVVLNAVSMDVVHSWWIPELGGKIQVVPGYHNYTWFKIDRPGLYRGQCANICGMGHARMIASVRAVPPAQFEAWLARQKQLISEANISAAKTKAEIEAHGGSTKFLGQQ